MKTIREHTRGRRASAGGGSRTPSVTGFGIRFTEAERQLLAEAAGAKGWSPSALIKRAAMDRASHILNTSRQTQARLSESAETVARLICGKSELLCGYQNAEPRPGSGPIPLFQFLEDRPDLDVWPEDAISTLERLDSVLQQARIYGGAEFLDLVITRCRNLIVPPPQADLPAPIDPRCIGAAANHDEE